jgi:hypothetical protein
VATAARKRCGNRWHPPPFTILLNISARKGTQRTVSGFTSTRAGKTSSR